jgi:hypothetical protein
MGSRSARAAIAGVLSMLALGAMASTAAGQTVELVDEATLEHCPSVSVSEGTASGGCPIHLVDDQAVVFMFHWMGIETVEGCHLELVAYFDEQGQGYVDGIDFSPAGPTACGFPFCPVNRPLPWPAEISESGGNVELEFELCLDEDFAGAVTTCPFRVTVTEPSTHVYQMTVVPTGCSISNGGISFPFPLEVEAGRLTGESSEPLELEILHI